MQLDIGEQVLREMKEKVSWTGGSVQMMKALVIQVLSEFLLIVTEMDWLTEAEKASLCWFTESVRG